MSLFINCVRLLPNLLGNKSSPALISVRHLRGKGPEVAWTLEKRLEEMERTKCDPTLHFKVNIGLPQLKLKEPNEQKKKKAMLLAKKDALQAPCKDAKLVLDEIREEWVQTRGPFHVKTVAEHYNIFSDLYGEAFFVPRIPLTIQYLQPDNTLVPVYHGNQIKPSEARLCPIVNYDASPSTLWSLLLTNPDGHFTDGNAEYIHWFIGNIPGNDISKGEEIVSYLQPFPPRGTGYQRFVFVLYKQDKTIDFTQFKRTPPCLDLAQRTFYTKEFYRSMQENITPAGLAFFQSDWDHALPDFYHNTLNMQEPIYDFDFPEPYKKPPVWFPKKEAFNLYMDKHRDPKQIAKELLIKRLQSADPFKSKAPEPKFPNAFPENTKLPSWARVELRKQRLKWGRYSDM